jgi:predicted site-specific integrase-resolvase
MDDQQVQELYITKRTLLNWRSDGKISYNDDLGKIFYFRQEIAKLLLQGRKRRRKK